MPKQSRDLKSLLQNDHDLKAQYNELLRLRAELARLLFRLKRTPSRKQWATRRNRLAVKRNELPERPQI